VDKDTAPRSATTVIVSGILINILNPKLTLFFFAFLPQFVDVDAGHVSLQLLVLGLTFVLLALLSDSVWAIVAGVGAGWLRAHLSLQRWVSGSVFVGLGLATAVSGGHRKG
jgi:threonine/homoserine/homoserine lactone efflux protein